MACLPRSWSRGLHYCAGPQSRYRHLCAPSCAGGGGVGTYAWWNDTISNLRFANQVISADWKKVLQRAQSLSGLLHLYQSRTGHVSTWGQGELPSRGIDVQAGGGVRMNSNGPAHAG